MKWDKKTWTTVTGTFLLVSVCLGLLTFWKVNSQKDNSLANLKKSVDNSLLLQVSSAQASQQKETKTTQSVSAAPQADSKSVASNTPPTTMNETLKKIQLQLEEFQFSQAHAKLSEIWQKEPEKRKEIRSILYQATAKILFSPIPWQEEEIYHIRPQDTFFKISSQFKIPVNMLHRLNPQIDSKKLAVGERIKILKGPFTGKIEGGLFHLYQHKTWLCAWEISPQKKFEKTGKYWVEKISSLPEKTTMEIFCMNADKQKLQWNLVVPPELSSCLIDIFDKNFEIVIDKI